MANDKNQCPEIKMKDQIGDLSVLEKKFQDEIQGLEEKLSETKRKLSIVIEAIGLLKDGGTFNQNKLFNMPEPLTNKYKDMSMKQAIKDVLQSYGGKKVSAETILSDIQKNGFVSKSKNLKRDVYTRLFRLHKSGVLGSRKEGGLKKYFIKEANDIEQSKSMQDET